MKIIIFALLVTFNVYASQFGLKMGMTLKQIDKKATPTTIVNMYSVKVPQPHKMFIKYYVKVSPTKALYYIQGQTKRKEASSTGQELKSLFENMDKRLIKVYGENERFDYANNHWDRMPWLDSLMMRERVLQSVWKTDHKLKDNLQKIRLSAAASESLFGYGNGYLVIDFFYENYDVCEKDLEEKEDEAF